MKILWVILSSMPWLIWLQLGFVFLVIMGVGWAIVRECRKDDQIIRGNFNDIGLNGWRKPGGVRNEASLR